MRWPLVLVSVGFLAVAGLLTYGGLHAFAISRHGTPTNAKILSCYGRSGRESCQGMWTTGNLVLGDGHVVTGVVEGASRDDIGNELPVVVSGDRAWTRRTASGVGGTALFFAALCLFLGIYLPINLRDSSPKKGVS